MFSAIREIGISLICMVLLIVPGGFNLPSRMVSDTIMPFQDNYYGTLVIPCKGIKIDLYCSDDPDQSQMFVDMEKTGWARMTRDALLVCDHSYQEFDAIKDLSENDLAFIWDSSGQVKTYRYCGKEDCYRVHDVTYERLGVTYNVLDHAIVNAQGMPVLSGHIHHEYPLLMYTCNTADGQEMTMTYWQSVDK